MLLAGCAADDAPPEEEGGTTGGGPSSATSDSEDPSAASMTSADDSTSGSSTTSTTGTSVTSTTSSDESGSSSDDSTSTGPDVSQTSVVVSVAHGGQTARSCDGGRTWSDFHDFGPQDDHSDYAAFGGITFGQGVFVAATGWGAPGHILLSEDGQTWEDLSDDAFTNADGSVERPAYASGVEFAGDHFVLFANGVWFSDDGRAWERQEIPSLEFSGHFREVEYLAEPGLLLVAVQHDGDPAWRIQRSSDGGRNWSWGDGVNPDCMGYVQHVGGFAYLGGRLIVGGGGGATCISDDDGVTWTASDDVGVAFADLKADDQQFLALGEDGMLRTSVDGFGWLELGQTGLDGGRIDWSAELGYFGGSSSYVYADDASAWADAAGAPPEGFGGLREFAIGAIEDDLACPE